MTVPCFRRISVLIFLILVGAGSLIGSADEPTVIKLKVEPVSSVYLWDVVVPGAIVTATDADDKPLEGIELSAAVHAGRVKLCEEKCAESKSTLKLTTKENGTSEFLLDLRDSPDPQVPEDFVIDISVVAIDAPTRKTLVGRVTPGHRKSFLSEVVASEFFLGLTFSQEYNDAGESEGFGNTAGLARLSVDTLWGYRKPWAIHTRLELMGSEIPSKIAEDVEEKSSTQETLVKFADSFSGSLSVYWFPAGKLKSYKATSKVPETPIDAFRLGFIGRFGIVTRDTRGIDGDSVIRYYQAGFAFTHHQTKAITPRCDNKNVFPIRFAEIKYGWYEEFAGVEPSHRIIFDGGIRLANTANGAIPFYAGLHVNAGDGADDIRIFAGFLFQLDKLATFLR